MSSTVYLADLLPHQQAVSDHPARFKVIRAGRRWGKDRLAFVVSWFGHGPQGRYAGAGAGYDVAWLAPDYPQARILWTEEIEPRFRDVPGVTLNETEHSVRVGARGGLYLFSAENVTSIRGLGKRLAGVVINEAAHLDLAQAWRAVIRPALADNRGWALIMSTTNSGTDGGLDEAGNRRVPSYFNTLCTEIRAGQRTADWVEFTGTAEDNPKIDRAEFRALVGEYPEGSTALQEEIFAALLTPGTGLAFPEWRDAAHVLGVFEPPKHWTFCGGFDWGFHDPSVLVLCAVGEEHQTVVMRERRWTQTAGFQIGREMADACAAVARRPEYLAADSSIWGVPARHGWANIAEEIQAGLNARWLELRADSRGPAPALVAVPKGRESRLARAALLHGYLRQPVAADGTVLAPRLRFLKSCVTCVTTIPRLPPDPAKPDDVDTTADDHAYDALTYLLLSRGPLVEVPSAVGAYDEDRHPGFDRQARKRKKPWEEAWQPDRADESFVPSEETEPLGWT